MIFHVITNFSEKGGAEAFLSRLCDSKPFSNTESKIVSLCQVSSNNKSLISSQRVKFEELGATSLFGMFVSTLKLAKLLKAEQPKVIFAWMYHAHVITTFASILAGYKGSINWCVRHSLDDFSKESTSTKVALLLCRGLSRFSSRIIYCSQRSMIQHQEFGLTDRNNTFLANGYVIPVLKERSLPEVRRLGIAGRFHLAKNYPCFLKAAKLVAQKTDNVIFHLCGRGVTLDNPEFRELVNRLDIPKERFCFMGEVFDMQSFYNNIDFFVLSSITEGFPNVLAEAMSYGVPSISTDVGDASYILGSLGNVVPSDDVLALSDEMVRLLELSDHEFKALSLKCAKRIESEFSIERVTQEYFNFIEGHM